jgi:4-hydroxy-3-polyprenylbenzoate decarboxylase
MAKQRMVVGITGATGIVFGVRLLQTLRRLEIESHLASLASRFTGGGHDEGI